MSALVIIGGHIDDDSHRLAARAWVTQWYAARGYDVQVPVATSRPWAKADAYNGAVAACAADVVVLADSDSFVSSAAMEWAVAQAYEVGWAVPFTKVRRLSRHATEVTLDDDPARCERPTDTTLGQTAHDALPGGGIVAMRTDLARACGPFDPRFRGWGGEDYALGNAARTLCGEYAAQRKGPLWHLWHPPQPRTASGDHATNLLATRYRFAKFRPDDMTALIEEGRNAGDHADDHARDDHVDAAV